MNQPSNLDDKNRSTASISEAIEQEDVKQHTMVKQSNRAKSGLSELSKQLRSLQAVNDSQAAHIDKLERKLQVLSDMKGVSLVDLKSALENACQGDAYNELRQEVKTLRAQLDIAQSNTFISAPGSNVIANLELRVGELEEVEESLRSQLSSLYDPLREQTTKATQFESLSAKHEHEVMEYKQKYENLQKDLEREHDGVIRYIQENFESKELIKVQELEKVTTPKTDEIICDGLENQLIEKEMQLKVHEDEVESLKHQLRSTEFVAILRTKQFESRARVQDGRISDLEQQLSSLLTAFNLERGERNEERKMQTDLKQKLLVADTEVAHFHHHVILKKKKYKNVRGSECKRQLSREGNLRRLNM
ncbi:hypothetical protein MHU86_4293 [Fragilaria crotonensis]|nr:hypothetical protein MHU86_4293 [Fragilaria crotonensis]